MPQLAEVRGHTGDLTGLFSVLVPRQWMALEGGLGGLLLVLACMGGGGLGPHLFGESHCRHRAPMLASNEHIEKPWQKARKQKGQLCEPRGVLAGLLPQRLPGHRVPVSSAVASQGPVSRIVCVLSGGGGEEVGLLSRREVVKGPPPSKDKHAEIQNTSSQGRPALL